MKMVHKLKSVVHSCINWIVLLFVLMAFAALCTMGATLEWISPWLYMETIGEIMYRKSSMGILLAKEDCMRNLFTWEHFKTFVSIQYADKILRQTSVGHPAPNTRVYTLETRVCKKLTDYCREDRPLVMNFGGCTCPPFVGNLPKWRETIQTNGDICDFLLVYVKDFHTRQNWTFPTHKHIVDEPKCLDDKMAAAKNLEMYDLQCPIVVDDLDSATSHAYGGAPNRLVIVLNGIVQYTGKCGPLGYDMNDVRRWITKYRKNKESKMKL